MPDVGSIIKARRKELSLTQDDLAERTGVSRMTVNVWVHSGNLPSLKNLAALESALEFPKGTLLFMISYGDYREDKA